jgi:hypothetical protein
LCPRLGVEGGSRRGKSLTVASIDDRLTVQSPQALPVEVAQADNSLKRTFDNGIETGSRTSQRNMSEKTTDQMTNIYDLEQSKKEHIANQCVCCGSFNLKSSPAILMPFISHRVFGWAPVVIDDSWGLRTIRNGHAYSICKTMLCTDCGFLFLDIRFTDSELANLYRDYRGTEYNDLRESYEPGFMKRNVALKTGVDYLDKIEEPLLKLPVRVLDWGGDTGKNTPFKRKSTTLDVYDISNAPLVSGVRRVTKQQALETDYDVVVCSNVLEHVPYPADLLSDLKKVTRQDTILYVEVPFEEVMRNGVSELPEKKRHWHEHINFFSEMSLQHLLKNVGMEVLKVQTLSATIAGVDAVLWQVACRLIPRSS